MAGDKRLIASTPQGSLRLLGSGGTLALRNHAQVRQYLRASLGEEEAAILAEPSFDNANGRIDWLSARPEEPQPLSALEPEAAERVRQRLAAFRGKVAALADQLSQRPQQSAILLGELLRHAVSVPNEESVLVAGEQPLLINWGAAADAGHGARSGTQLAAPSRRAAPPPATPAVQPPTPPPAAPPAASAARGATWLWTLPLWLLFGALMAAIYFFLLEACAVSGPGAADDDNPLISFCPGTAVAEVGPPPELAQERARAGLLKERLRQLEIRIAEERRACRPGSVPSQTLLPEEEEAVVPEEELAELEPEEAVVPEEEPVEEPVPEEPPPEEPQAEDPLAEDPLAEDPAAEDPVTEDPIAEDPAVDPEEFQRRVEEQGGQEGLVQATLIWDSETDLDLFVVCPNGESINYTQPTGCGGGSLDIDANVREIMPNPVEHITWPQGAPPGEYVVLVRSANGKGVDRFQVQIEIEGETRTYSAQVHPGQGPTEIARFTVD